MTHRHHRFVTLPIPGRWEEQRRRHFRVIPGATVAIDTDKVPQQMQPARKGSSRIYRCYWTGSVLSTDPGILAGSIALHGDRAAASGTETAGLESLRGPAWGRSPQEKEQGRSGERPCPKHGVRKPQSWGWAARTSPATLTNPRSPGRRVKPRLRIIRRIGGEMHLGLVGLGGLCPRLHLYRPDRCWEMPAGAAVSRAGRMPETSPCWAGRSTRYVLGTSRSACLGFMRSR